MQNGFLFDNIYVGHSEDDANKLAEETWSVKHEIEKTLEPEVEAESLAGTASGYLGMAQERFNLVKEEVLEFVRLAQDDLVGTVKQLPHIAGLLVLGGLLPLIFLSSLFSGSSTPKSKKKKEEDAKSVEMEKPVGTSSGVESPQKEVKKRAAKKD